ncbi:MAG: response regulator transcription factor [Oligoflexus sp.]|nr:response regulator transcription factor [Pseudopedobacter sp.]
MIDIVIADDHKLFAQGLATILAEEEDFTIKAIFNDGRSMIDYLSNQTAHVAIIDLNMPQFDGKSTLVKLHEKKIEVKKLVLSMYAEKKLLDECVKIGIDAYLLKDVEPETLTETIRKLASGIYDFDTTSVCKNGNSNLIFKDDFINRYKLSKREIEVLKLITEGLTNHKIAEKLFLSTFTIDTHRKNIIQKINVKNTAELVKFAFEQNL